MYNQLELIMSNPDAVKGVYSLLHYAPVIAQGGRVIDEQRTYAKRWAKKNRLPLNVKLAIHPHWNALESFWADVEAGDVLPGSILIIDGLDDAAIKQPAIAQGYLGQIISAGVTIVMAADGRIYSPESVKQNPMALIHSTLYMIRSHEEQTKGTDPAKTESGCSIIPLRKPTMTGKVYSYIRFSDMVQRHGNSVDRQWRYAEIWANEHGMPLDDVLTIRDDGLSAYHQRHVKNGALGVFLKNVEYGRVPPGSVLIVEGLDRLSRAEPLTAQSQLALIINAGVTVVTAADNKVYSRETLNANPMDLIYSLIVMIRAHEESHTKSKRVSSAIIKKCENWVNGISYARNSNGNDPVWLRWNGKEFEVIEEQATFVRYVIDLYLKGYGWHKIARKVENDLGLEYDANRKRSLARMIKQKPSILIGTRTVTCSNGREYVLQGYYPAIIDQDTYNSLIADSRQPYTLRAGRPASVPGILSNGVFRCGYCGCAMISTSDGCKTKPDNDGIERHYVPRRYRCYNDVCQTRSVLIVPIENAIMDFCSNQMNLNSLVGRDKSDEIRARLAATRATLAENERQLKRLVDAMLSSDAPPAAFAARAREIENEIAGLQHAVKVDESALLHEANAPTQQAAQHWATLSSGVKGDNSDARMTVRKMVAETFEKIVFYRYGIDGQPRQKYQRDKEWLVVLVSRSGVTRHIRISRTGELLALLDVDRQAVA